MKLNKKELLRIFLHNKIYELEHDKTNKMTCLPH